MRLVPEPNEFVYIQIPNCSRPSSVKSSTVARPTRSTAWSSAAKSGALLPARKLSAGRRAYASFLAHSGEAPIQMTFANSCPLCTLPTAWTTYGCHHTVSPGSTTGIGTMPSMRSGCQCASTPSARPGWGETEFAVVDIALQSAQQPNPARDRVDCLARHGAVGEHLAINLRRDSAISYTRF